MFMRTRWSYAAAEHRRATQGVESRLSWHPNHLGYSDKSSIWVIESESLKRPALAPHILAAVKVLNEGRVWGTCLAG